jgi:hypothetical protein
MWLRILGAVVLGLFLYIGATLMCLHIFTGSSQMVVFIRTALPVAIAVIVVGIAAMGIFNHA